MRSKINISEIFRKWLLSYKKGINFSIIDKPSKALQDSFNAGYTLSERHNYHKMLKIKTMFVEIEKKEKRKTELNQDLLHSNKELQRHIYALEDKLNHSKKMG